MPGSWGPVLLGQVGSRPTMPSCEGMLGYGDRERWRAAAGSSERPDGREEELRKVPPPQGHGCRKAQGESSGNGAETIPSLACAMIPKG